MKKTILIGATLAIVGLASAPLFAQTQSTTTSTTGYIQSSNVIGSKIKDSRGQDVGEIKDFVLDRQTGCLAYVVLSTRGTGTTTAVKTVAAPWSVFSPSSETRVYTTRIERERIYSAPVWESTRIEEYSRPDYINSVYGYYGVTVPNFSVGITSGTTTGTTTTGATTTSSTSAATNPSATPAATAAATSTPAASATPAATAAASMTPSASATPKASPMGTMTPATKPAASATAAPASTAKSPAESATKTSPTEKAAASPKTSSTSEKKSTEDATKKSDKASTKTDTTSDTSATDASSPKADKSKKSTKPEASPTP